MKLTEHFTLEEMVHSNTADAKGIENRITAEEVNNLQRLCQKVLEPLRQHFGKPIHVNSGFRCKEVNAAVHGAPRSYHLQGRAADIPWNKQYFDYIKNNLPHVELINEGGWIHVAV